MKWEKCKLMLVDGLGRNEFTFYEIFRLISNRLSEEFGGFVFPQLIYIFPYNRTMGYIMRFCHVIELIYARATKRQK